MRHLLLIITFTAIYHFVLGQYATPGTGISWNLTQLASQSGGVVTENGLNYTVSNDLTISANDTLKIMNEATLLFTAGKFLYVNGTLITGSDTVTFKCQTQGSYFGGIKFENSPASVMKNAVITGSGGIKVNTSDMLFDGCVISNNAKTFASGAINPFQCSPVITRCRFTGNLGPAIMTGANAAASPQIIDNYINGNNVSNANMPQINLGTSAADTIRIIGNTIIGMYDNTGGIAVSTLAGGTLKCVIKNNLVHNNRYGIAMIGNNIYSEIAWNTITNNNIQNNPNLGGSGLNFNGGNTNTAMVYRNTITGNLWGVTIQQSARPNLGKIEHGIVNIGRNVIMNNSNNGVYYNLYNNTAENIDAENNFWGTFDLDSVEMCIFHYPDNSSLGTVDYVPIYTIPTSVSTPGTGVHWNMQQLADHSDETIRIEGSSAIINVDIIVSQNDTLNINDVDTLKFYSKALLTIEGNLLAQTRNRLVFTGQTDTTHWGGIAYHGTQCLLQNTEIRQSMGTGIFSPGFKTLQGIFTENYPDAGHAAVFCGNGKPVFEDCLFTSNAGPAIESFGTGITIKNSHFLSNQYPDTILPQLIIGKSGLDTVFVSHCEIVAQSTNSGGINVWNDTDSTLHFYADSNQVTDSRYGVSVTGKNIQARLTGNYIADNQPAADPAETGTGIYANGDSTVSICGSFNFITSNYRGISLIGHVKCNLGQTDNNPGHNYIFDNLTGNTELNLFNGTPNVVYAQYNYWGTINPETIEQGIIHAHDNPSYGLVVYQPFITMGINNSDTDPIISLYPNPVHDLMYINHYSHGNAEIVDPGGIILLRFTINPGLNTIDPGNIKPGIYFLRITDKKGIRVRKIVKI